jgi:hypothetical protein
MKQKARLRYRVLDVEGPKIEVTISENGTLKGRIETTDIVTYCGTKGVGSCIYKVNNLLY